MFEFQTYDFTSQPDRHAKFSTLTSSRAKSFRMSDGSQHHLSGSMAVQPSTGLHMMLVLSSGHEIEVEDDQSLTVMMPRRSQIEVRHGDHMRAARDGGVVIIAPSLRRTLVIPPEDGLFDGCLLKLPVVHPLLNETPARSDSHGGPFVCAREYVVPALSELVSYVLTDLASDSPVLTVDHAAHQVHELFAEHIRRLLEPEPPSVPESESLNAATLVRIADEFMRSNYYEPLRVTDIAKVTGVAARQLQAAFKTVTGHTPRRHLTAIRLERARLRLLSGSEIGSISGIALDCGFTHLGRFSILYREVYGETPSETLRSGGAQTTP